MLYTILLHTQYHAISQLEAYPNISCSGRGAQYSFFIQAEKALAEQRCHHAGQSDVSECLRQRKTDDSCSQENYNFGARNTRQNLVQKAQKKLNPPTQ